MTEVRSRWLWPVFCAGLLGGLALNQLAPVQRLQAGPTDNNGLAALRADFNRLKSQLNGLPDILVQNGDGQVIGLKNAVLEGRVSLTANGQETAAFNDPNRAIISVSDCPAEGQDAISAPCGRTTLGETVFRDVRGDITVGINSPVGINNPVPTRGIIAILTPPPPDGTQVNGLTIQQSDSTAFFSADALTFENSLGRTSTTAQGVRAQMSGSPEQPELRAVLEPAGVTLSSGADLVSNITPYSIELLVLGRPWMRTRLDADQQGRLSVDRLNAPAADLGHVTYDTLNQNGDYDGDTIYIPPQ